MQGSTLFKRFQVLILVIVLRIQLSRNNEFFPGTNERVMLISGTVKSVLTALFLILQKLAAARKGVGALDKSRPDTMSQNLASSLKIVMPSACCGAILGKGGRTVKQFVEDSGASISVLAQVRLLCVLWCIYLCLAELRLSGNGQSCYFDFWRNGANVESRCIGGNQSCRRSPIHQQCLPVCQLCKTSLSIPRYTSNTQSTLTSLYSLVATAYAMYHPTDEISAQFAQCNALAMPQTVVYPTGAYAQMEHPSASFGPGKYCQPIVGTTSSTQPSETEAHSSPQSHLPHVGVPPMAPNGCLQIPTNPGGPRIEMSVSVPDERIGAIIGRGGEIITQLQTLVGVKIIISGRNEFEPGTRNRRVTIIGPPEAVQIAHMLICMKVRIYKNNSTKNIVLLGEINGSSTCFQQFVQLECSSWLDGRLLWDSFQSRWPMLQLKFQSKRRPTQV